MASGENRRTLRRIATVLLALADLAEGASARPRPILTLALWILRPAEALAWRFVVDAWRPATLALPRFDDPAPVAADCRFEARRLAEAFRWLAAAVDGLATAGVPSCSPGPRRGGQRRSTELRNLAVQTQQYADTS